MLIHMFMHVSNVTSQHTSLHTKRMEKEEDIVAFSACYTVLHNCQQGYSSHVVLFSKRSSHVCLSINKYMYLFAITTVYVFVYVYQQLKTPIHQFLHFYITVITTIYSLSLVLQIVLYITYIMTCKSCNFSLIKFLYEIMLNTCVTLIYFFII